MDAIDRQAAIDAIQRHIHYDDYDYPIVDGDDVIKVLTGLPSAQPERWIPVSERLPEKDGYYLTTTMYYQVYRDYWNGDNWDRTEMVIAWMPLPEPYKGEKI